MNKVCSKCKIEKSLKEFGKNKCSKDGLYCYCKVCVNMFSREYRDNNQKQIKEYYIKNKEQISKQHKEYRAKPENKIKHNLQNRKNNSVPENRLMRSLGASLRTWLKHDGVKKNCRTSQFIRMSKIEFREYFESLFTEGMTWEKVLSGEIHIDHIKPKALFNAKDPEEVKRCWHYSNLQPLWAADNMSKGAKYNNKDYRFRH